MDDGQAGTYKISNNQEYFNNEKANIQCVYKIACNIQNYYTPL